ncbi:hypothetical protein GCM10010954_23250 [Halobacillus andaensis]|uniref:Uncharacterized protein n=1 Tax=Halobacillus andaensis TaxID=1176239 RepID=A0A917B5J8_HALAA|nr:hypothetical protein GCM10010954_23250 [Halobacillus andaensis]
MIGIKSKKLKFLIMIIMSAAILCIASAYSYMSVEDAKSECSENNGTVTEENVDFLAVNWSISCEN